MQDFTVRVVTPPAPFVLPADIPGEGDDTTKARLIAAVTRMIAAPSGWLNRSLGKQTLELRSRRWPWCLPYGPIIRVVSIKYDDAAGVERTVDPTWYRLVEDTVVLAASRSWPVTAEAADSVRVTYEAGHADVPPEAAFAVILAAQNVLAGMEEHGGLRSAEVTGAFVEQYNSPDLVQRTRTKAIDSLLANLRRFA